MRLLSKTPLGKWKYGYLWVTLAFFLLSLLGHWVFSWYDYVNEQSDHGRAVEVDGYVVKTMNAMMENWQSEFLQLIWQVAGLSLLLYIGSPQSKEGDDRKEEKLDQILKSINPKDAERIIAELDRKYPKK